MRPLVVVLVLAALSAAAPAIADSWNQEIDRGGFVVKLHGRVVGAETFEIEARADSVFCQAHSYRTQHTDRGDEEVQKSVGLVFGRTDWALRFYQSEETFRGVTLIRGVTLDPADTALTVFKERKEGGGTAIRLVAPPGRTLVLDSGLYTLFDVICIYLHGQTFTSRPLNILTFGERDTVVEAVVTDLGRETIRWAARPVVARKLSFQQGPILFHVWVDPAGKMLRLEHEPSGLRVDREAPPIKRRVTPAPKPGG